MAGFLEPILHVDMDAFFVEVERRDRPELRGVPVIVGGLGGRGVVAAASYEARGYGVRSAMPMVHARRLCPAGEYVAPDHRRYREASVEVFGVFRSFTPLVEGLSVDEAFLDVAGLRLHYPDAAAVGQSIRAALREELGLPASVGVASNKFLAKLASEEAKPDGILLVASGTELAFLHPLGVRRMWGVGEATFASLEALGIKSIGELAATPIEVLERRLGAALSHHLHGLAKGEDPREVEPDSATKSLSVEQTFEHDLIGTNQIEAELVRQTERLGTRLRRAGLAAGTVTLKVRYRDFTTLTRSQATESPIDVPHDLLAVVRQLATRVDLRQAVRLLGVAASSLQLADAPRQLGLERSAAWDDVAKAVDEVRSRFGDEAVTPARLVDPPN